MLSTCLSKICSSNWCLSLPVRGLLFIVDKFFETQKKCQINQNDTKTFIEKMINYEQYEELCARTLDLEFENVVEKHNREIEKEKMYGNNNTNGNENYHENNYENSSLLNEEDHEYLRRQEEFNAEFYNLKLDIISTYHDLLFEIYLNSNVRSIFRFHDLIKNTLKVIEDLLVEDAKRKESYSETVYRSQLEI